MASRVCFSPPGVWLWSPVHTSRHSRESLAVAATTWNLYLHMISFALTSTSFPSSKMFWKSWQTSNPYRFLKKQSGIHWLNICQVFFWFILLHSVFLTFIEIQSERFRTVLVNSEEQAISSASRKPQVQSLEHNPHVLLGLAVTAGWSLREVFSYRVCPELFASSLKSAVSNPNADWSYLIVYFICFCYLAFHDVYPMFATLLCRTSTLCLLCFLQLYLCQRIYIYSLDDAYATLKITLHLFS